MKQLKDGLALLAPFALIVCAAAAVLALRPAPAAAASGTDVDNPCWLQAFRLADHRR